MDLTVFVQGTLNSIVKRIPDLFHSFKNAYFNWKEGAETGVSPPSDEYVPNSARQISWFMKCAGALWKPYYDSMGEQFIYQYIWKQKLALFVWTVRSLLNGKGGRNSGHISNGDVLETTFIEYLSFFRKTSSPGLRSKFYGN